MNHVLWLILSVDLQCSLPLPPSTADTISTSVMVAAVITQERFVPQNYHLKYFWKDT